MDLSALSTLEFNKIRALLAEKVGSALGKELAEKLTPSSNFEEVERRLQETAEARMVLDSAINVPLGGIRDIRALVKRAEVGSILEPHELVAINSTLFAGRRLKTFFLEADIPLTILMEYISQITILRSLENLIESTVDEHGNIRDDASVELLRIRREIKSSQNRVKERIDSILRSTEYQKYFQDALVTMRGDRYVIPIKQEYRHSFPGIVHDQSSSGATVFIEPMAVVNLNNEIKQLMSAEKNEVERILYLVSAQIAKNKKEILINCQILAQLDFAFAKARLSVEMNAFEPKFNQNRYISLKQARHPLIHKEQVVPIDIVIGKEYSTLLITGPNTGGKTVSLKTLGLFTLMTQSGMFIPAESGSEISMFENVYADIGDEQSIEQSLSTFSAHMTNLVKILQNVSGNDLVLIDEIGAGTDPDEGAALAMSILEYLMEKKVTTLATTHYSELKTFAYSRSGVENASVEFDVQTLRPTYRLLIGVPGSSNAFAISHRLGLPKIIIENAQQFLDKDHAEFAKILRALEEEKIAYIRHNEDVVKQERELAILKQKMEDEKKNWNQRKEKMLNKAQEEAGSLLRQARREAEAVIKELKLQFAVENNQERQQAIEKGRNHLNDAIAQINSLGNKAEESHFIPADKNRLKAGMTVFVSTLKQKGIVLHINDQEVTVQMGIMKMNIDISFCSIVDDNNTIKEKLKTSNQKRSSLNLNKVSDISRQVDLRGITVEEAEAILSKYLDDAVLAGLNEVTVIHGKGTGALRKGVRMYLENHPNVADFRIAEYNEGGDGATVVRLV